MDSRAAVFSAALMSFPRSAALMLQIEFLALMLSRLLKLSLLLFLSLPLCLSPSHTHTYTYHMLLSAETPRLPTPPFQAFGAVFHPHVCTNLHACGMIWGERICQCRFCGRCFILFFCYRLRMQHAAWWCNRSVEKDVSLWEGWGVSQSRCLLKIFTLCAPMACQLNKQFCNSVQKGQQRYDTGLYRKWINNVCSMAKTWQYRLKAWLYLVIKGS